MNEPEDWHAMAVRLQLELVQERELCECYETKMRSLEVDVDKLKTVIEYLEIKLGINDSI
jgi:broad-specificity NMP kinase